MEDRRIGQILAGVVLILMGILITTFKFYHISHLSIFHLLLGGLFLAGYFYGKTYGFLIPGCILFSLGLTSTKTPFFGFSDFNAFGLGLGFVAIYVIDKIYRKKNLWWPLIPGIILILTGIKGMGRFLSFGWPVLIIIFGLYLILKSLGILGKSK